jgi:hypothetical protein
VVIKGERNLRRLREDRRGAPPKLDVEALDVASEQTRIELAGIRSGLEPVPDL